MKFGDYLRQKREEKNWTQPEASAAAGIEQSYLSKLETGKSWPSEDVFARLAASYGIDVDDMVRRVGSSELSRLREIGAVRSAILEIQNGQRVFARGWLVACLVCLAASGGCFGAMLMAKDTEKTEFDYRSMGVLEPGEGSDAFDIAYERLNPQDPNFVALQAQRQKMIERIDENYKLGWPYRGGSFIERLDDGWRLYTLADDRSVPVPSPLHLFVVPALAFLAGGLGCAFISFRWR